MTQDKRPEDFQDQIEAEEIKKLGSRAGGDALFGTATAPTRYRCADHGVILATDVLWRRDGKPYCPTCGKPLEEIE